MTFGEWWGLTKAFAKDEHQKLKNMALAVRLSKLDNKAWDKFMAG